MKQLFFAIALALITFIAQAQQPGGMSTGIAQNGGHLFGKIVGSDGKPIADVSIMILQSVTDSTGKTGKPKLVKGLVTSNNGDFDAEDLPVRGSLKLNISATGFVALEKNISFAPAGMGQGKPAAGATQPRGAGAGMSFEKDMGKITLAGKANELQEITVVSTKSLMKLDIDKKFSM